MPLTLKKLAPWWLVTGIMLCAIWGVLPFYFSGKREAGIELLARYSRQLCSYRLAHDSYPEQFEIPEATPGFSRISYVRPAPQDFLIEAEMRLSTDRLVRLQARPAGVFVWSAVDGRWAQEKEPAPGCRPPG